MLACKMTGAKVIAHLDANEFEAWQQLYLILDINANQVRQKFSSFHSEPLVSCSSMFDITSEPYEVGLDYSMTDNLSLRLCVFFPHPDRR